jgi:hypothetical protein
MIRWLANNEAKGIWKEEVAAYFKKLTQHLPGGTGRNHEKPQSG